MASQSLARYRSQVQQALGGRQLPFDDDVLGYLSKVAPASNTEELLELIGDFCPKWSTAERLALMRQLMETGAGQVREAEEEVTRQPLSSPTNGSARSSSSKAATAPSEREVRDLVADQMLAQMLQESEEPDLALSQGQNQARSAKKSKKGFRPLPINYTVGQNAAPAVLGAAAPSSLADLLRSRRQGQARMGPMQQAESFGPSASRSSWAPVAQDVQGMTWAERTQLAQEQQDASYQQVAPATARAPGGLSLKLLMDNGAEYQVQAEPSETVGDVKLRVEKLHSIPFARQRLLLLGKELTDSQNLRSAGITSNQPLQLALRPAPPPAQRPPPAPPPAHHHWAGEEELMVRLRLPGGVSARVEGLPAGATVPLLKQRIQKEHGIRADHVALSFFGVALTDGARLADLGVATGAIIDVSLAAPRPMGATAAAPLAAPVPSPPSAPAAPAAPAVDLDGKRRKKRGKSELQEAEEFSGLQLSRQGRVLTEDEALELALAASRNEAAAASSQEVSKQHSSGAAASSAERLEDTVTEDFESCSEELPADARLEAAEFHVDISAQDNKQDTRLQTLIAHARRVASMHFSEDLISKVSKRSGYRLTLLAEKGKKVKTVLGYSVYRFRQQNLNVLQMGAADEQRVQSVVTHLVTWIIQYGKKANVEVIALNGLPALTKLYQKMGFKRVSGKSMDGEEANPNVVYMEYRCRKQVGKPQAPKAPLRPDFEPPPPYEPERKKQPQQQPVQPVHYPGAKAGMAAPEPVGGSQAKRSRRELVCRVFSLCDADGDGCLNKQEMLTFGVHTGFDGSVDEWAAEFAALCSENGRSPHMGVDLELLTKLVDDESDAGCHCSDAELREMAAKLEAAGVARPPATPARPPATPAPAPAPPPVQASVPARPAEAPPAAAGGNLRDSLTRKVFSLCDVDGDGRLNQQEMLLFATQTGFDGTPQEWAEEFKAICAENHVDVSKGVDQALLRRLLDDQSDCGCHCTNDELKGMVAKLQAEVRPPAPPRERDPSQMTRSELVAAVMKACDLDGDGQLLQHEMLHFALQTGFEGSSEEWGAEFGCLCEEQGSTSAKGISAEQLARLVDDKSDRGCFCTDDELRAMVTNLRARPPAAAPSANKIPGPVAAAARTQPPAPAAPQAPRATPQPASRVPVPTPPAVATPAPAFASASVPAARPPAQPARGPAQSARGPAQSAQPAAPTAASAQSHERAQLAQELFRACDSDGDGWLRQHEMQRFAQLTGFEGNEQEWAEEYSLLCSERRLVPAEGIPEHAFTALINDESDAGQYCTDNEIRDMLTKLRKEAPPPRETATVPPEPLSPPAPAVETPPAEEVEVPPPAPPAPGEPVAPPQLPAIGRADLARAVFRACDADGDKRLNEVEMRTFASRIGFDGTANEWSTEFQSLCVEHGRSAEQGVDIEMFLQLVDDQSDNGCYCSNDELRAMVRVLFPEVKARTASRTASRPELVRSIFQALDKDSDERLNSWEMKRFAAMMGFDGGNEEWDREFMALFEGKEVSMAEGVGLAHFTELVNDASDSGCYCSDDELVQMNNLLMAEARKILVNDIFCSLDGDHDGQLSLSNLERFARLAGYTGGCDHIFSGSCEREGFSKLVDGQPVSECYCTTEKLRQVLTSLRAMPPSESGGSRATPTSASPLSIRPPPGLELPPQLYSSRGE